MDWKKKIFNKLLIFIFLISIISVPNIVFAYTKKVVLGGENIGIKVNSSGVLVVGFYSVAGKSPAKDAGLKIGDRIIKINDTDINIIGYNIFDRITKEGRKYGVILGFITQRPNELSKTALSQCSNFITFRMFYPEDLNLIASISSNISKESIEKIKTLSPGVAMVFGNAFKIPLIVSMNLPDPMPKSSSVDLIDKWYS